MDQMSPHVNLALHAITSYVADGETIVPSAEVCESLSDKAGVFVSLKKNGELRGCIGTIAPTQPSIAHEIVENAISAATRDPRFLPVEVEEIPSLTCSVDVLFEAERIDDPELLDPIKYGVIVECGMRRGLLLPNLEGVDTVEDQIDIACRKAMIRPGEPIKLYRFEVKRFY